MRESLKMAVEIFGNQPVNAVELGVAAGANAQMIFDSLNIERLSLIDSWNPDYNADCILWMRQTEFRFAGKENVVIIRHEAITAANLFKDGSLDYLYIDDNHAPKHVYKELCAWYDKMKDGGIVAGHDWADNGRASAAVIQFCNERGILYYHAANEGEEVADWWFFR
ncbi:MAG: hypothetical protein UX75_C0037G0022 [Candidatus Moranbacteria bacterium GW2011_GWE2_47_10]|nr:MAG: hypothetical protein UX75_C0037G0022 [Candidatus Moranbacteria bacterium GW2011_GWE2_47_10]